MPESTVEKPEELLSSTELSKRIEMKTWKPRVYEKIRWFRENEPKGAISPIIRLAWSYLCNFTCDHCCAEERMDRTLIPNIQKAGMTSDPRRRMNYEDLARHCAEADEYGLFRYVLTGGEPTTWKDLYKVIEIIDPQRHLVIMDSNAWLLAERPDMIKELWDRGVYKMQISLDSGIEAEHDAFRNKAGSWKRVMKVLPLIRDQGFKMFVSTCLVKGRVFTQEFEDLCKLCADEKFGLYITLAKPTGSCREHKDEWVCTKEDVDQTRRLEEKYPGFVFTHMSPSYGGHTGCIAAKGIYTLEPQGEMVPCPYMDWSVGNVLNESLAAVLDRGLRIRDIGPQRNDCVIGEDPRFIAKHNGVVQARREAGNFLLPVPFGQGWTEQDLIQIK